MLQPLKIRVVRKNGFNDYMRHIGKLGGQNKIPKLSNDRSICRFFNECDYSELTYIRKLNSVDD